MGSPPVIQSLLERSLRELAMEIQIITRGTLGLISNVTPPNSFPMRGLRARQFAANRNDPHRRDGTRLPACRSPGPQYVAS